MKRLYILFIIASLFSPAIAQIKPEIQVYLWDVTLSMKGYQSKTPDIYDKVVEYIERDIDMQKNEHKTIVVCPFQEKILARWQAQATNAGKQELISKIKAFDSKAVTNTNIADPLYEIERDYINKDKFSRMTIILLTDGKQNTSGGNATLLDFIDKFKRHNGFAYLRYVALTEASVDQEVKDHIEPVPNAEFTDKWGKDLYLSVAPQIKLNIKDDSTIEIPVECDKNEALPAGIKVSISQATENQYLPINATAEIIGNMISVPLKFNYTELKAQLGETTEILLNLQLMNNEFVDTKTNVKTNVSLSTPQTKLILINKPEKTLKIRVKKDKQ